MRQDMILTGGRVLTMHEGPKYTASAIAMRQGRILAVGTDEEVTAAASPGATVVPLGGRVVTPGHVDTHTHVVPTAVSPDVIDCRDFYVEIGSVNDILRRFAENSQRGPDQPILRALGSPMQALRLAEGRLPTGKELDDAVPDRPAIISFGAHVSVVNSKALELVGYTSSTSDPAGGVIARDSSGKLTGLLHERAQRPFRALEDTQTFDQLVDAVERELTVAATRGVTKVHDMVSKPIELKAYQELARLGRLPIRVDVIIRVIESFFPKWGLLELGLNHGFGGEMLGITGIKMSIDGGFTGRGSAWSSYDGEPEGNHPLIRIRQDELDEVVTEYHKAGMRICVHAIGDEAADMILSSYEKALLADDRRDLRHRIEHMGNWLMDDTRIKRAKAMGLTPVPNPAFFYYLGREAERTLGSRRTENSFPIRRLVDEGFHVSFGADAPGYWPIDPLRDAGAVVSRTTRDGLPVAPGQAISNYEALATITSDAAWVGYDEDTLGTIEPGKFADLTVLAGDPLAADGTALSAMSVDGTVVNGRIVWASDGMQAGR